MTGCRQVRSTLRGQHRSERVAGGVEQRSAAALAGG